MNKYLFLIFTILVLFLGCKTTSENNDTTNVNVDREMTEYLYADNETKDDISKIVYMYNINNETKDDVSQTAHMYNQLALGFNTREYFSSLNGTVREYYILNNDKYSNVQINEWRGTYTPGQEVRYEFHRYPNTYIIVTFGGGIDINGWDAPLRTSRRGPLTIITQDNKVILEYENALKYNEGIKGRGINPSGCYPFNKETLYNSPENEIEHIYLTLFVRYIVRLINLDHFEYTVLYNETPYKMEEIPLVKLLISQLKKHELSIMRNLLFARHNYAFRTEFWQDFMNTYYPKSYGGIWPLSSYRKEEGISFMENFYHGDYIGLYTESEIINKFDLFEQRLLEIIIEYENN